MSDREDPARIAGDRPSTGTELFDRLAAFIAACRLELDMVAGFEGPILCILLAVAKASEDELIWSLSWEASLIASASPSTTMRMIVLAQSVGLLRTRDLAAEKVTLKLSEKGRAILRTLDDALR